MKNEQVNKPPSIELDFDIISLRIELNKTEEGWKDDLKNTEINDN